MAFKYLTKRCISNCIILSIQTIFQKFRISSILFKIVTLAILFLAVFYLAPRIFEKNHKHLISTKTKSNFKHDETLESKKVYNLSSSDIENYIFTGIYKNDRDRNLNCNKWVVITSVNFPTEHVKYVQDALFEWCVLVVGDSKSPSSWAYKDITFLSIQDQEELAQRYSIVPNIPTRSYLRKIVGYLYAIEHGAKYIYETDDDNAALDGLLGFRYEHFHGLETDCDTQSTFVNPYAYFGQSSVWPRGFPLEMISEKNLAFNCSKYRISDKLPLVQQGLVNGDPDVDAIYR